MLLLGKGIFYKWIVDNHLNLVSPEANSETKADMHVVYLRDNEVTGNTGTGRKMGRE